MPYDVYIRKSHSDSYGFYAANRSSFKKYSLLYSKNLGNIIKINNKFSQNLIDRLIAIKLIRISNKLSSEEIQNKNILKDQYKNNIKLAIIQRFIDCSIEPVLLMVTIPVIIVAIKLSFPLAKLGVFHNLISKIYSCF